MSEETSSKRQREREDDWSNLPRDLLSNIADDLGLMELMNLRGVCKDWRNVSSENLLNQVESFGCDPWFLLYDGEGSKCSLLLSNHDKICTATIPELEGATCLASHEGWLLVFRGGSMFFFCPFSMAKIELPNCPFTELSGHVAAFSAPPTSQDCNVVVIRRGDDGELELHLLSRGHDTWAKHNRNFRVEQFSTIAAAIFIQGVFHFRDDKQGLVTFDAAAETEKWTIYRIIRPTEPVTTATTLNYSLRTGKLESIDFSKLGLDRKRVSISACGTLYSDYSDNGVVEKVIPDESIEANISSIGSESPHFKGVWIMPRYHTPSMDHRW